LFQGRSAAGTNFGGKVEKRKERREQSYSYSMICNVELNTFLRMFTQPMNAAKEPVFPTIAWLKPANQINK